MVQLLTLPPELLIKIVDQVAVAWDGHSHFLRSRDDPLIALSSTSHLLRHFSLPALFATLTLRASCPASLASTVELVKTCDGIRNHPEIPKLVTRLRIDCRPSRLDGASFDRANPSYLGGVLDQPFCRLVRSLARLREFNAFVDGQAEPIDISPALVYSLIASPSLEVVDLRRVYCANPIKPVPSPSPRSTPSPAGTSTPSERPRLRPIAIKLGSSYSSSLSILDAFCDALDRNPALDYFLASIEVREHINTIGPASKGFAPGAWLTLRKIELSDFVINGAKDAVLDSLTTARRDLGSSAPGLETLILKDPLLLSYVLRLLSPLASPRSNLRHLFIVLRPIDDESGLDPLVDVLSDRKKFPALRRLGISGRSATRRALMQDAGTLLAAQSESLSRLRDLQVLDTNFFVSKDPSACTLFVTSLFASLPSLCRVHLPDLTIPVGPGRALASGLRTWPQVPAKNHLVRYWRYDRRTGPENRKSVACSDLWSDVALLDNTYA